jgi:molybdopterin synthase sulfur carrier subunit
MDAGNQDIAVRFFASMKDMFGRKEARVSRDEAPDVGTLLKRLCTGPEMERGIFADSDNLRPAVIILLNGRNIAFLGGLDAVLQAGDEIAIFPPLKGG